MIVLIAVAAEDSFAAILARNRLGIAIAAMMRMIAMTISNSTSENPFSRGINDPSYVPTCTPRAVSEKRLPLTFESSQSVRGRLDAESSVELRQSVRIAKICHC